MFTNFQQITTFFNDRKKHGVKPGLDRINYLLQLLGNPHKKLKAIHVAGTNGKGSTVNYIKDALVFNGYHVGVFSSPSFDGLTGHILIDDKPISEKNFITLLNEMYPAIQELDNSENHPTEFEIITVLAFVYFVKHVDFALIETGMGGREDTTNCIIPTLSIITNVTRDHIAFLGNTIEEIAYHKAGIIKEDTPVIIGEMEEKALVIIEQEADLKHASLKQFGKDFSCKRIEDSIHSQKFIVESGSNCQLKAEIQMQGSHQLMNASLAIMALLQIEKSGTSLDWEQALTGIYHSQVPGRFEIVHSNPTVIIDGAHNEAGIHSFIETVLMNYPNQERHLLFAGFKDKELGAMLSQLYQHFTSITVATFNHPRAASAEDLYEMLNIKSKLISTNWKEYVDEITRFHKRDQIFFITGSLHFITKVRKYFVKR